jgi:hypothetical protein
VLKIVVCSYEALWWRFGQNWLIVLEARELICKYGVCLLLFVLQAGFLYGT